MPIAPAPLLSSNITEHKPPRQNIDSPLSRTLRGKQLLEKYEQGTEKEQAKDLKVKTRVRVAKFILRGVNFSCSLIVIAMLSMTFTIFNTTKHLAPRSNFPPWAQGQKTWPQITVLVIACISLSFCLLIFWNYWRGGHGKAEKFAVYYTLLALGFFVFSIVMWAIAATVLQQSKTSGHGKDMWGWSCVENKRRKLFQEDVDYALVCRMQDWSLVCCLIEIVLECITVILYSVVFYRYYSKQRLRKSMDVRDRARSDLYLTQLHSQSSPKALSFGSMPLFNSQQFKSPSLPPFAHKQSVGTRKESSGALFIGGESKSSTLNDKSFALQPVPIEMQSTTAMPKVSRNKFEKSHPPPAKGRMKHLDIAPGEQTYDAVPIPSAYASPALNLG